jgi:hypothetical protein
MTVFCINLLYIILQHVLAVLKSHYQAYTILKDCHIQHNEMFHFHVNVDVVAVNSRRDTQTGDDADKGSKMCKLYL